MLVAQVVVDDKCRSLEKLPLYILLDGETTIAQNIVVGGIAYIVLGNLNGTDTARVEGVAWSQLEGQLG